MTPHLSHEAISAKVRAIIAEALDQPVEHITAEAKLRAELGMDSLALIDTSVHIEEEFRIELPDLDELDLKAVETVGHFVDLVAGLLEGAAVGTHAHAGGH